MSTTIEISVPAGSAEALLGRPSSGGGPGVLLFMDALGLRPRIETMVDRIAAWGYVVLAPNMFYRVGSAAELAPPTDLRVLENREAFMPLMRERLASLTTDLAAADIDAYLGDLAEIEGVTEGPVGTVGYCMGARLATRAAGRHPERVAAVGGFHGGGLVTDAPDSPHLALSSARAEFVYGHAAADASMPPEAVDRLGAALTAAGLTAKNEVYDGPHGYSMSDTAAYHEQSAERSFAELEALFARTLRGR